MSKHELARPFNPHEVDKKDISKRVSTDARRLSKRREQLGTKAQEIDNLLSSLKDRRIPADEREQNYKQAMALVLPELLHANELLIDCMSLRQRAEQDGQKGWHQLTVAESADSSSFWLYTLADMLNQIGKHFMVWKDENGALKLSKYDELFDESEEDERVVKLGKHEDFTPDAEMKEPE